MNLSTQQTNDTHVVIRLYYHHQHTLVLQLACFDIFNL